MELKELQAALVQAEKILKKEETPENKIAVLELKNSILEAEKKLKITDDPGSTSAAKEIGDAISKALRTKDIGPQQPVKSMVDKLIDCDEVIFEKSEKGKNIIIVETLRKGVKISPRTLELMNQNILTQERGKAYLPKGKKVETLIQK